MDVVLYEFHFRIADLPVLLIPLLVGVGFWAVSCRMVASGHERTDLRLPVRRDLTHSRGVKGFLRGIAVLCGLVFLLAGTVYLTDYTRMKASYDSGAYQTVEGVVEDLTVTAFPDKGGDSFTVGGVSFAYSLTDLTLHGYRGEGELREGQRVVIHYVYDPDTETNHILYIAEGEVPVP